MTAIAGVPCTSPERATYDAARLAGDLRGAVRVLDMAFAGEITSASRMSVFLDRRDRSAPLVRAALRLASERSLSPPETAVRLVWVLDAGLPVPLVNHPVLDRRGRLLGIPDLFDTEHGVAVEYDGADHREKQRHAADVDRESDFRDAGCEVVRIVAPNLRRPERVVARFMAARERAMKVTGLERGWRLDDPGPSLDERMADRQARERQYLEWLDDPVGPPPSA